MPRLATPRGDEFDATMTVFGGRKLERFDIADVEEHRALSDAEQTQMCFEYMRDEQRRRDC